MPDHGVVFRVGGADCGGARGWHQRAKSSIMVMCPPQHGHGGRRSGGFVGFGVGLLNRRGDAKQAAGQRHGFFVR